MNTDVFLVWGILLCAIAAFKELSSKRQQHQISGLTRSFAVDRHHPIDDRRLLREPRPLSIPRYPSRLDRGIIRWQQHGGAGLPLGRNHLMDENERVQFLYGIWRRSIVNLLFLADRNLNLAQARLRSYKFTRLRWPYQERFNNTSTIKGVVEAAATSTENVARALIYCYGGKPNPNSGQEEVLLMLARRLKGDERKKFEKAVENVESVGLNKWILRNLETKEIRESARALFDDNHVERVVNMASEVLAVFRKIIKDNFTEEIPELLAVKAEKKTR